MTDIIHELPPHSLRALAASLREGPLSAGVTRFALQQIAGARAAELEAWLAGLGRAGMGTSQMSLLVETVASVKDHTPAPTSLFDLVLSGPEVPGIPTADTAAVMHTLIEDAQSEVLLVAYAVHNGPRLFGRLAAKMQESPSLRVVFCLDIPRRSGDTSSPGEIVSRFAKDFKERHWPWPQLPELFYDPRSLSDDWDKRSSLHAKCVVVDRRAALVTSANLTEAARLRNIEAGVVVRYPPFVDRLVSYVEGLRQSGQLARCPLG